MHSECNLEGCQDYIAKDILISNEVTKEICCSNQIIEINLLLKEKNVLHIGEKIENLKEYNPIEEIRETKNGIIDKIKNSNELLKEEVFNESEMSLKKPQANERFSDDPKEYKIAIDLDPKKAEYHNNLANLLSVDLKRYNEAEKEYKIAIDLDPKNAVYHNNLAAFLGSKSIAILYSFSASSYLLRSFSKIARLL